MSIAHWQAWRRGDSAAPPLVLLHGFLGCGDDWAEVAAGLSGRHQVVCPDLPWHGGTVVDGAGPASCAALADALADWLRAEGLAPCAVAGYSLGGRIALHLALQHPDTVRLLVLESAGTGIAEPAARAARRAADAALAGRLEALADGAAFEAFLGEWYAQPVFASVAARPGALAALVARRRENDPRALATAMRRLGAGTQDDLAPRLGELGMPVWWIAGELDPAYRARAEALAAAHPGIRAEIVAGAGHNVHWEAPGRYTALLNSILSGEHRAR
jgi:2-succinyl-6-hydroxy-2,4-cyclohexadiene-1-carboxylate synthase